MASSRIRTEAARLLVHLPSTKNSSRRFVVPILRRSNVQFDIHDPSKLLASLKYNRVVQGKLLTENGRPALDVAVKTVPWSRSDLAWNEIEMFSLAGKHPFLLDFIGISQDGDDSLLVVTELIPQGLTLEQYCVKQAHTSKSTPDFRLLNQLARAMAHLHATDIIHRDLKASNVFVKREQHSASIRLADLDRATVLLEGNTLDEPCGSLFHMAPELLKWEKYDRKVDVYAFGVLLYEFAHGGASPYTGSIGSGLPGTFTQEEFAGKVTEDGVRPQWKYPDPNLRRLAERCWSSQKDARPEFEEIVEALQREFPLPESELLAIRDFQHTSSDAGNLMDIGTSASIGHIRKTMEDALAVLQVDHEKEVEGKHQMTTVCGVFDGLRMHRTAEFAARKFALNVFDELCLKGTSKVDDTAIKESLMRVDSILGRVVPEINCGSTATVIMVNPDQIFISWLGDSSAYLFRKTTLEDQKPSTHYQAVSLITKHSPDRPDELERIDSHNGSVGRETVYMDNGDKMPIGPWRAFMPPPSDAESGEKDRSRVGIAVSRALGLFQFRPVISGEAEFVSIARDKQKDAFLVLASDGLWDLLDLPQVLQAILECKNDPQAAADLLVKRVLQRGAHDNVSVIVMRLDQGRISASITDSAQS